jgi:hypothetical protein
MWGQRNSKYAAAIGTQLLAKIHCLESQLRDVGRLQNHLVDKLQEQTSFIGDAVDRVGRVVDELNERINLQDVQINQLADMVNDLVRRSEKQAVEIKNLKAVLNYHWLSLARRRLGKGKVEMDQKEVKGGLFHSGGATENEGVRIATVGDSLSCSRAKSDPREQRAIPESQRQ